MTTKKSLEFTGKNVKSFTLWLKRFSTVTNSLLLEIDLNKSMLLGKVYNEERSVVKMSSITFDETGLTLKTLVSKDSKRVKVGIFSIPRLIKIMDQFNDTDFSLIVEYQEFIDEAGETQYASEKLLFKNKDLKMNLDCSSLEIFKYISDDKFINTIAVLDVLGEFELTKANIEKINALNNLDNEDRFMEFRINDHLVSVVGKTYNLFIDKNKDLDKEISLTVFKEQYTALDIEEYNAKLGEDRIVFHSKDSSTITVISKAENQD